MSSISLRKAVICVFDGLRPDRVTAELMPNLWRFATEGTWYRQSRSVFPSVTRVATTSFATGAKPEAHGIMNNAFYHRQVLSERLLDTSSASDLRAAETFHGGRFVEADGLGCALARADKSFSVVHTGSAGSAYLVNHKALANGHWTFSTHGPAHTQTPDAVHEVVERFGPLPQSSLPRTAICDYGTHVFIEHVLRARQPDVALLWFAEPDTSYHFCDIGSANSVAIAKRIDQHFGSIIDAIAGEEHADETLIVAMSDHGQIATAEHVDLHGALGEAGFPASNKRQEGMAAIASLGEAIDISLFDPDPSDLEKLAHRLMEMPEIGLLFSKGRAAEEGVIAGTLPFGAVGIGHERAADLVCVLRSSLRSDQHGLPGSTACTTPIDVPLGGGMHGGLNPYELNTMLAFGGPPAPALGSIDDPADLTDIVPTLLASMGVPIPISMTGHPLAAMIGQPRPEISMTTIGAGRGSFEQALTLATGGPRPVVMSGGRAGAFST